MAPKAKHKLRSGTSNSVLLQRARAAVKAEARKRRAAEKALRAARKELQRQQPQQSQQHQQPDNLAAALQLVCSGQLEREQAAYVVARLRWLHTL